MTKKLKRSRSSENNEDLSVKQQDHFDDSYYDTLHEKIVSYLTSGQVHSTLVGIIINLDGNKNKQDIIEATRFADYFINFLKKVN